MQCGCTWYTSIGYSPSVSLLQTLAFTHESQLKYSIGKIILTVALLNTKTFYQSVINSKRSEYCRQPGCHKTN